MGKTRADNAGSDEARPGGCCCPFCLSRRILEEARLSHGGFFTHLNRARLEALLAVKSLLEERISSLERREKKVTKVKVD